MSLYLPVSETHPLAQHTTVPVSALRNQPMVLLDLPVINDYYQRLFESAKVKPHIACKATSLEIARSIVATGVGCSILHMRPKTNDTYSGQKVVEIPIANTRPVKIVLGNLQDRPRKLIKYFADSLL